VPSVCVYGCFDRDEGAVVVVELKEIKLPILMKGLPGFIMSLDELKKVAHFYENQCFEKRGSKRRTSSYINLDDIINYHKPKSMKVTIDY
jgi:hypothetical protein